LVQSETAKLIEIHGDAAYSVARNATHLARNRADSRSEKFFAMIAVEIARRTGREIGVDTATRYQA
jgi:hypothetical protein